MENNRYKGFVIKQSISTFFAKGYRVTFNGQVISKRKVNRKLSITKDGYYTVVIRSFDGKCKRIPVHKLVAYLKYGDSIFEDKIVVRHLDGNQKNNSFYNIAIGTQLDNIMDMSKEARMLRSSNPVHNHSLILKDRKKGLTYDELMLKYGVSSKGTISFIINKSLKSQAEAQH